MPENKLTDYASHAEWLAEGRRRFGKTFNDWKFVCPVCKHVAAVGDYQQYADKGSTPSSATSECIGRYIPGSMKAFEASKRTKGPCDYAGYGLFRLSPVRITAEDGHKIHSFAFAEVPAGA